MLVPYSYLLLLGLPFINANPTKHADLVQCLTACKVPQFLPSTSNFTYWIQPFNMRLQYTPVALAVPSTVPQVQAAVACASKLGISVNPRSGGHNYASHDIGGEDGHFVIDLKMFQNVTVDPTTQIASVGPGIRLGNMALALYAQGKRAISHGVCPG
jgi:FAD/FMN-containing dehydrogenase